RAQPNQENVTTTRISGSCNALVGLINSLMVMAPALRSRSLPSPSSFGSWSGDRRSTLRSAIQAATVLGRPALTSALRTLLSGVAQDARAAINAIPVQKRKER